MPRLRRALFLLLATAALLASIATGTAHGTTYTVDRADDEFTSCTPDPVIPPQPNDAPAPIDCTLRGALSALAGNNGGATEISPDGQYRHVIKFAPGFGTQISVASTLPPVPSNVYIDGVTDQGAKPTIKAAPFSTAGYGLLVSGDNSIISGLGVEGFNGHGVIVSGNGNRLEGLRVGPLLEGSPANTGDGIRIDGSYGHVSGAASSAMSNVIGGITDAGRNAIFRNGGNGIAVVAGKNTIIRGNLAGATGPDIAANNAGNAGHGILLASHETVLEPDPSTGGGITYVQNNAGDGIRIGPGAFAAIRGAQIGGPGATGNSGDGIEVAATALARIGPDPNTPGDTAGGNTVAGNDGVGVRVASGAGVVSIIANRIGIGADGYASPNALGGVEAATGTITNNVISGNRGVGVRVTGEPSVTGNEIGTAADGTTPIPNQGHGVIVEANGNGATVAGNAIAHNLGNAIRIKAGASLDPSSNTATGNAGPFFSEAAGNPDQPEPVVGSATSGPDGRVVGRLTNRPNTSFRIAVHRRIDSVLLSTVTVSTGSDGRARFAKRIPTIGANEQLAVVATALDTGDASEVAVVRAASPGLRGRTLTAAYWDDIAQLNGAATVVGNLARLTDSGDDGGSVFTKLPVIDPAEPFSAHFAFHLHGGSGRADGITFALQRDERGPAAVGTHGGQMGYGHSTGYPEAIRPSLAVEVDTHDNSTNGFTELGNNHISVLTNGDPSTPLEQAAPSFDLYGAVGHAWVEYDGENTLRVYAASTDTRPASPLITAAVDLTTLFDGPARAGFTGATGGSWAVQDLVTWELENAKIPTSTAVLCTRETCGATVTETPGTLGEPPTGTVSFSGAGSCNLSPTATGASACTTPARSTPGAITASYAGGPEHFPSTGTGSVPAPPIQNDGGETKKEETPKRETKTDPPATPPPPPLETKTGTASPPKAPPLRKLDDTPGPDTRQVGAATLDLGAFGDASAGGGLTLDPPAGSLGECKPGSAGCLAGKPLAVKTSSGEDVEAKLLVTPGTLPVGAADCDSPPCTVVTSGRLTYETRGGRARAAAAKTVRLTAQRLRIGAGEVRVVTVKLPKRLLPTLRQSRRFRLHLTIAVTSRGKTKKTTVPVTVVPRRP